MRAYICVCKHMDTMSPICVIVSGEVAVRSADLCTVFSQHAHQFQDRSVPVAHLTQ